jgi:hypothetical protein
VPVCVSAVSRMSLPSHLTRPDVRVVAGVVVCKLGVELDGQAYVAGRHVYYWIDWLC